MIKARRDKNDASLAVTHRNVTNVRAGVSDGPFCVGAVAESLCGNRDIIQQKIKGGMMNRSELLSGMFAQFEESAHTFCTDSNGLFCEIVNDYKGIEKVQNLKRKTTRIYYKSFAIEFAYTSHGMMGVVNSILSCSVYPDKSENSIGIPLPLVTDYFGMDVEAPLCIPLITNEQAMLQAFRCVAEEVKRLLPVVAQKCSEAEQREELQQKFCDEMRNIFQIEISGLLPEPQRRALADFFVNRFSSDAFLNALRGNREKAVKQLGKRKSLTGYETRMQKIW